VVAGKVVLLGSCSGVFYAFDRATGEVQWRYDTSVDGDPAEFHGDPLVTDRLVITGCDRTALNHTYALELATGRLVWKQDRCALESDLVRADDAVAGRTWNGDLVALELETGRILWRNQPQDYFYRFGLDESPVEHAGVIYVGGVDGVLYAVDGTSGKTLWSTDLGTKIMTAPATDGIDVYVGAADSTLRRFSAVNGEMLGVASCQNRPLGRLGLSTNAVCVLEDNTSLAAYGRSLGEPLWRQDASSAWTSFQPLVVGNLVVVGSRDGVVTGFRCSDGETQFSTEVGGVIRGLGYAEGVLFVGTLSGQLHALRIHDDHD
jgi:outer membrane protein assembly factor BamB